MCRKLGDRVTLKFLSELICLVWKGQKEEHPCVFSDPAVDIIAFFKKTVLTWLQPAIWAIRWDWEEKKKRKRRNYHLLEELSQLVNGCAKNLQKRRKPLPNKQLNNVMEIWYPGLTGRVHSRNNFHCHIKDTWDPPYRERWVEGLTAMLLLYKGRYSQSSAKQEPRPFLKGRSRQPDRNWTFSGECYYKRNSECTCWQEEDQIFSSPKKEVWKSQEILSVTAYNLFLPVVFLTRTDLSDLSLEKYIQPVLPC